MPQSYAAVRKGRCSRCNGTIAVGQLVTTITAGHVASTAHAGACPPARVERGRGPAPRPDGAPGPSLTGELMAAVREAVASHGS